MNIELRWLGWPALAEVLADIFGAESPDLIGLAIVVSGKPRTMVDLVDGLKEERPLNVNGGTPPVDAAARTSTTGWYGLTDRETAIAFLVGQALTNRQIASRLFISPHTVNYHLRQIFRKLDINSRVHLAQLLQAYLSEQEQGC